MGKSSKRSRRKTRRKLNPYNIYMRDEIAAIKERDPKIPHREAFTQASRTWSTSLLCNRMRNPKNQFLNNQEKIPRNKSKRREIIKEKKAKKQTRKQVIDQKKIQKILNNDKTKKQETIFQDILHIIGEEYTETEAEAETEGKRERVNANDDELDVEMSETNENEDKNIDNQHHTVITDADVNMTVDDKLDVETESNAKNEEMVNDNNNANDNDNVETEMIENEENEEMVMMNQDNNDNNNDDNGDKTEIEISKANQMVDDERDNDDQMVENEAAENDETIGSGVSEGNQAAENETIGSGVSEGNQVAENETINLGMSEGNQVAENETINSGLSEENQAVENEETIKPGPMHDVKKIIEKITDIESLKHSDIYKVFEQDGNDTFICDSCKRPYLAAIHLTLSNKWGSIVRCYGITKDPSIGYMLVENRMYMNLREYLKHEEKITWEEKVKITYQIIKALGKIHKEKAIHKDLHSGNILYSKSRNYWYISDLGLCGPADKPPKSVYGNLPYIAPEVIAGKEYSYASDIYSIGILMWEISSGQPPFANFENDFGLANRILDGMRPKIISGTPLEYIRIMKQCWDANTIERSTTESIKKEIKRMLQDTPNELNNNENIKIPSFDISHESVTSKVHQFADLPEPKNASEEEQEAFHSKPYDYSIPQNIDDWIK
ncbi:kinase-like domain-containing protein [Rhizophagus diaphanus]|nr:kinase-like domain-containing protein [Rhizophagus diaphanus] [Rhizophagus sp. MUCL 43196]